MKAEDRKAATADWKERKTAAGIYAVRCQASGQCWAGRAPDLGTIQNRLWFTLRQGTNPHPTLQAAWQAHGIDNFSFEAVERIEDESIGYVRDRILKDRLAHWCAALGAEAI
jgi:hypothetical protein